MSKIMYAVYRSKMLGRGESPVAMFERSNEAKTYMQRIEPTWMRGRYRFQRVVINETASSAYALTEHIGYKVKS